MKLTIDRDINARECHIAQTRKRLKNARETALFGARVPARRGVARIVSLTRTLSPRVLLSRDDVWLLRMAT